MLRQIPWQYLHIVASKTSWTGMTRVPKSTTSCYQYHQVSLSRVIHLMYEEGESCKVEGSFQPKPGRSWPRQSPIEMPEKEQFAPEMAPRCRV